MEISQAFIGFTPGGEAIVEYTMQNAVGATVRLINFGAAITSIVVPDRQGGMADVVLGYADWRSYRGDGAAMGKSVGRYANRIALGRFSLDGVEYHLAKNNGPNALHGGPTGFADRVWTGRVEGDRVIFSYVSADGEEGFPGELSIEAAYEWSEWNALTISYSAKTDRPTVVNLTNHAYFNLAGEDSGTVLGHTLSLRAARWLPTDTTQIPTGEIASVVGTPMDFTVAKPLGQDIAADFEALKIGHGYDHCWLVDGFCGDGKLRPVAELHDTVSGRVLTVNSTQPAVQVYTGNWLDGSPMSKSGRSYANRDGVAIECQSPPDAPNKPNFRSPRLDPRDTYNETIIFSFSIK